MSDKLNASNPDQTRASRIQIEVREISSQPPRRSSLTRLDVDGDGGDIRNSQ